MTRNWLLWLPFALVFGLFALFWVGLSNPGEKVVESNVIGQQLPEFRTVAALPGLEPVASGDFGDGKPRLLNVFASWCVPCVQEIPILLRMQASGVEIHGVAIHDRPADLAAFLARNGNPYDRVGLDNEGRAQLAFGSAGVPETFVIDGRGRILHQHIGIVTETDVPILMAMLEKAR